MRPFKKNWWKVAVCLVYALLLSIAVLKHEPWFDEAQAWLLARDSSLFELFSKYLRYEGSTGLWHLLLMVPAKLNLPYISLNILSAVIAFSSVCIFIFYSPFPAVIKIIYPFTFFAFYQYAVVARSYVLLPLLLFCIALVYKHKNYRPFLYIFLICLLANVSLHGAAIAGGMILIHLIDLGRGWRHLSLSNKSRNMICLGIFCIMSFLIVLMLRKPKDLVTVASFNYDLSRFFPKSIIMLSDSLATNLALDSGSGNTFNAALGIISKITIVLSLFWFILRKKLLIFLVPSIALCLLFSVVYAQLWHQGILFYVWIFTLWLSFEDLDKDAFKLTDITKSFVVLSMVLIMCIQIYWSFSSFMYDFSNSYSASRETANYIKAGQLETKKIYVVNFHSISILPYFSNNIFDDYNNRQKPSFWLWSTKNAMYVEPYLAVSKYDPDIVIFGVKSHYTGDIPINASTLPEIKGYKFSRAYKGALYWKDRIFETDSFAIYEKANR